MARPSFGIAVNSQKNFVYSTTPRIKAQGKASAQSRLAAGGGNSCQESIFSKYDMRFL
jgi:hypothetical protein